MLLGASGVVTDPDALAPRTYLPGRKGSLQLELVAACRQYNRIPYIIDPDLPSLVGELLAGRPVLVLQNLGLTLLPAYHYAVVIGVLPPDEIVLRSGDQKSLIMDIKRFLWSWERADFWGMIALKPGEMPTSPDPGRYLSAVSSFEAGGNFLQAYEAYLTARTAWPENQTALFGLGNNYLYRGQYHEAEKTFRTLIKSNPGHIAASNNLAEALMKMGCYSQALIAVEQALLAAGEEESPFKKTVLQTRKEISHYLKQKDYTYDKDCSQPP